MKSTISMDQWRELLVREARGDFGEEGLGADIQWFADNWQTVRGLRTSAKLIQPTAFPTTYDCSLGLVPLIQRAVGERNLKNINSAITQERFPLKGAGVRTVNLRVKNFLNGETDEEAAKRLTAIGHTLANTGDLAGFLHDHPKEVEKWSWVVALSKDSRWARPGGCVLLPCACVHGARRRFILDYFRNHFDSGRGVLVRCE